MVMVLISLILGVYIHKTNGRGKYLPVRIQPQTVRIYQFLEEHLPHTSFKKDETSLQNKRDCSSPPRTSCPGPIKKNNSYTQTITYRDHEDLLRQLKKVRTGQNIDLQPASSEADISRFEGRCSETAARAAFIRRQHELNDQVNAELRRIAGQ